MRNYRRPEALPVNLVLYGALCPRFLNSRPAPRPRRGDVYTRLAPEPRGARCSWNAASGVVWVEGELSNFSQPASGHWYFSLKDGDAQLRCAMFRTRNTGVGFTPRAGAQVLARGRISLYEARGDYQLIVEHLEEAGRRRAASASSSASRRSSPPRGCSRSSASARCPLPAAHRGDHLAHRGGPARHPAHPGAPLSAGARPHLSRHRYRARPQCRRWSPPCRLASARAECDVLILARGGGSLEDLWAFNDERVARAIHACACRLSAGWATRSTSPSPTSWRTRARPRPPARRNWWCRTGSPAWRRWPHRAATGGRACGASCASAPRAWRRPSAGWRGPSGRAAATSRSSASMTWRSACGGRVRSCTDAIASASPRAATVLSAARRAHLLRDYRARHEACRHDCTPRSASDRAAGHRLALAQRALNTVSPLATLARGFAIVTRAGRLRTHRCRGGSRQATVDARLARGSTSPRDGHEGGKLACAQMISARGSRRRTARLIHGAASVVVSPRGLWGQAQCSLTPAAGRACPRRRGDTEVRGAPGQGAARDLQ